MGTKLDWVKGWREQLFAAMARNAEAPMTFFKLPLHRVVELGSQGRDLILTESLCRRAAFPMEA